MVQFRRTGDADYPRFMKIVNMASPKAGKTTFESTAPNVLICATPNAGLMSIAHLNIPYVDITHPEELRQVISILQSDALRAKLAEQYGIPKIETVCLDLLNEVQQMLIKERLRQERRTQMQRDDWNWLLNQMRELINAFVQLPMNVILTVHVKTTQDDESRMITAPALQGGIQEELAGFVDFIVMNQRTTEIDPQTGAKSIRYSLRVEGDDKNPHLGNRGAGRLPYEVEPNFQVLYDAIFGNRGELPTSTTVETPAAPAAATPATPATPAPAAATEPASSAQQPAAPVSTPVESSEPVAAAGEVAQTPGQPEQAPTQSPGEVAAPATPPPPSDEGNPINEAGIKHVSKFYTDAGFTPPNFDGWTLGFARQTARMFVAVKADVTEGKETWDTMRDFLRAMDQEQSFQVWNGPDPTPEAAPATEAATEAAAPAPAAPEAAPKPAPAAPEAPSEPVASEAPAADVTPAAETEAPAAPAQPAPEAPKTEATEADAVAAIEDKLEGQAIGVMETEDTPCVKCGNKIEDIDIARLSKARFGEWTCVKDYMALTQEPANA